jgi:hypothetical protein
MILVLTRATGYNITEDGIVQQINGYKWFPMKGSWREQGFLEVY